MQVVEVDPAHPVSAAAHRDHARTPPALEGAEQQPGESEVAKVVGAELELEALLAGASRRRHDAGVVDQQVEAVVRLRELLGEGSDRLQAGEIEGGELRLGPGRRGRDLAQRGRALVCVAAGKHDPCARAGQLPRRDQAEAAVGARDHGDATALIGYLAGRPLVTHPGSSGARLGSGWDVTAQAPGRGTLRAAAASAAGDVAAGGWWSRAIVWLRPLRLAR